ncbi:hypothetical protein ACF09E_13475 [Streptomyces sp. NPDC014891]|uniref:hypothetical protein n=1 Tax=Streptomyces sp. NPDC014891 TaxID=3364929 RepID=UPI0036FDA88C
MTARQLMLTNRVVLGLSGLGVLGCVAVFVLPHVHAFGSWWPGRGVLGEGRVAETLSGLRSREWWPAVATTIATTGCLFLSIWCVRQLTRGTSGKLTLRTRDAVTLRRALERAVTEEALKISGVAGCRTRIGRDPRRLRLRMTVALGRGASPDSVLPSLEQLLVQVNSTLAPQMVLADVHFVTGTRRVTTLRTREAST